MAQPMKHTSVCIMVMVMLAMAEATPPGIANNPSQSTCSNGKYKYCKNLVHVCPKFCPNGCTTECVSCKPICTGGTPVPGNPGSDPDSDPKSPPSQDESNKGKGSGDKSGKGSESPPESPTHSPPDSESKSPPSHDDSDKGKGSGDGSDKGPKSPPNDNDFRSDSKKSPRSPPPYYPPLTITPPPSKTPSIPESPPTPSPSTPSTPESPPTPSPPTPSTPESPPTPSPPTPSTPESPPTPSPPTPSTPESPQTPSAPTPSTPESPPAPSPPTPSMPESPQTPSSPTPSTPESPPTPSPPTPSTPESPRTPSPPTPSTPSNPSTPPAPASTPPSTPSLPPTTPSPPSSTPTPPTMDTTPPTYPPSTSGKKRARCKNKKYDQCYNIEHVCPSNCPGGCEVDCVTCKPVCKCDMPGAVCQDPRFIGGDGITFYFHGKKEKDFCLVSDSNIHINGHFIGKRSPNMTRDFTWVQSIGILFGSHKLFIGAQKTAIWNGAVDRLALAFDGEPIFLPEKQGAMWQSGSAPIVSITRVGNTNNVIVEVEGNFKITAKVVPITEEDSRVHSYGITEDNCFAHLDIGFKFYSLSDRVNGILGQTYGPDYVSKVNMGISMPIMGGEKEFSTSNLFSTDCSVSQFNGGALPLNSEMASLSCGSGMDGEGVVCKR